MRLSKRKLALIAIISLLTGLAGGSEFTFAQQAGGGSPLAPEILFIDFPNTIASDGSREFGRVGFEDSDADIIQVRFEVVEATDFSSFSFNPKITGRTNGAFEFFIFSKIEQTVTLSVTLVDEAGNESFPAEFTFESISRIVVENAWGGFGSAPGQFMDIGAMAMDSQGRIYVSDFANHRVQIFSPDGQLLEPQLGTGTAGDSSFELNGPIGIAIDHLDNIYVAEAGNRRINKFDRNFNSLTRWGGFGSGNGQFNQPSGIAVDANGDVYVLDQGTGRVQVFGPTGTYKRSWGSQGSGDNQLSNPMDIYIDVRNNVFIADLGNDRVVRYTTSGSFVSTWGSRGTRDGEFIEPRGVFVDIEGNVYVTDRGNNRLMKFTAEGVFLAKTGSFGSGTGEFIEPIDLVVDKDLTIYIADEGNHRVQKIRFIEDEN